MKTLLLLIWIFLGFFAWGYEKRPSLPLYTIVSDQADSSVNKGECLVTGQVIDQSGRKINGALIATVSRKYESYTNNNGIYNLIIKDSENGIFMFHAKYGEIVISEYDFKSGHRVVIDFNPELPSDGEQNVKKPVIYLYSTTPLNVSVTLEHPGMTFMYPAYDTGWSVQTSADGNLTDQNTGKSYPYLFWEAKTHGLTYQISENAVDGFFIRTDTLVTFLEKTLTQAGLNATEQTDFITFWAPQLIQAPYVFIHFLIDESYASEIAPIAVNPLPDSQRRIFMLYTPIQNPATFPWAVETQQIPSFNRTGLTLVEWGGAEVNLQQVAAH